MMKNNLLSISDLVVNVGEKNILKGINLSVAPGEVHAIMGPNGSGKSTLSHVIVGKPGYEIQSGRVQFKDEDLLTLSPEERAVRGIFLSFQYPVEIPGVSNIYVLKAAVNAKRKQQNLPEIDAFEFLELAKKTMASLGISEEFLYRDINAGFSGGEKKRNEILQMHLLDPCLAILDETDSGLDIDALKMVAEGINALRGADKSIILVTHYKRLLDYVKPDFVHVLANGKIQKTGDRHLAETLEATGYAEH